MAEQQLTTEEVAEQLRLTPRGVAKLMLQGKLVGRKVGKTWRTTQGFVNRYLSEASPFNNSPEFAEKKAAGG